MFWDFITLRPETTHQVSFLFSDRGIPDGFMHMNGHGSHTYKLVNEKNEAVYCKFHYKTDQGIKNLPVDRAAELVSSNPDCFLRELYNTIAEKRFPSWSFYIQVMTFDEAEQFRWNPFDSTKVWPHAEFPMIPVGKIVLNRNPTNYFKDVEQIAFCPSHLVPGIETSPDKMLQSRLFSYTDTQRHRLGTNFLQIPVNCPFRVKTRNYQRDGPLTVNDNQDGAPNYFPNSFKGPDDNPAFIEHSYCASGQVKRYNSSDEDNYSQVTVFYRKVLNEDERTRLVNNIVNNLGNAQTFIQERAVKVFSRVDPEYGQRIREGLLKLSSGRGHL